MTAELIDCMTSLTELMTEESAQLTARAHVPAHHEIAEAKQRLVGRIEAIVSRSNRETPGWAEALPEDEREALSEASRTLRDASTANAEILSRQIEISVEMMAAIAAEAQRLTGKRNAVYGASGGMTGMEMPAPISINARL